MIDLLFEFGSEVVLIRIVGTNVVFGNTSYGARFGTIDNLKLSHSGVIKEFPDLENRDDWQIEARNRFKRKIKEFNNEKERADYIIEDLEKKGYKLKKIHQSGHRPSGDLK